VSALSAAFSAGRDEGRALLVGYLPAGFAAPSAFAAMVDAGVDVVEVGLPYSDPLMDGPTIQAAVQRALDAGTHTRDVLATVEAVAATGAPTLVMTYWNPVERYGVAAFARDLAAAGGAGVITPDLIPEEAGPWLEAVRANDLDPVFLVAPSSSDARIRGVAEASSGFIYAASTMGVTGAREACRTPPRRSSRGSARPRRCRSRSGSASPTARRRRRSRRTPTGSSSGRRWSARSSTRTRPPRVTRPSPRSRPTWPRAAAAPSYCDDHHAGGGRAGATERGPDVRSVP
jgi:tryptophan synthase alpha subunit